MVNSHVKLTDTLTSMWLLHLLERHLFELITLCANFAAGKEYFEQLFDCIIPQMQKIVDCGGDNPKYKGAPDRDNCEDGDGRRARYTNTCGFFLL